MFKFNCVIAVFVAVFLSACASKQISQDTQTANSNEPSWEKLDAECDKNKAESCYDLGYSLFKESGSSWINNEKLFDDELLNLAKSYLLKSCDLNYGEGDATITLCHLCLVS